MTGGSFKTVLSHSINQPVTHPGLLFFKVHLTYRFLFGPNEINRFIRSISKKITFNRIFPFESLIQVVERPSSMTALNHQKNHWPVPSKLFSSLFFSFCRDHRSMKGGDFQISHDALRLFIHFMPHAFEFSTVSTVNFIWRFSATELTSGKFKRSPLFFYTSMTQRNVSLLNRFHILSV